MKHSHKVCSSGYRLGPMRCLFLAFRMILNELSVLSQLFSSSGTDFAEVWQAGDLSALTSAQ